MRFASVDLPVDSVPTKTTRSISDEYTSGSIQPR